MATHREPVRGDRADVQPLVEEVVRIVCDLVREKRLRVYLFGS